MQSGGGGTEQRGFLRAARALVAQHSVEDVARAIEVEALPLSGSRFAVLVTFEARGDVSRVLGRGGRRVIDAPALAEIVRGAGGATLMGADPRDPRLAEIADALVETRASWLWIHPLATPRASEGAIAFAFGQEEIQTSDAEVLEEIAGHAAIALENVRQVSGAIEVTRANDRLTAALERGRDAARLELPEVYERLASVLHGDDWRWDQAGLCVYEPEARGLRAMAVSAKPGVQPWFPKGGLLPLESSSSGQVFLSGETAVFRTREEYARHTPERWRRDLLETLPRNFSGCIVPLACRGRTLGTLAVACGREDAFPSEARDFLERISHPVSLSLDSTLAHQRIAELLARLERDSPKGDPQDLAEREVVGRSEGLRRVLSQLDAVADTDATVLLLGETGTGKELMARAVHRHSARASRPFIKLNCAAIPTGLLESELFGHEKGAFTSAVSDKPGRFEMAQGGTLFLDEVGEIPLELQPKLLRVLQDRELERVGGVRTIKVDVRVVAATNRDLGEMIEEGTFRSDLYHRLAVFPIMVPPLRERAEDIPALVRFFTARASRRLGKSITEIPAETLDALERYGWPGNIRELENAVERAVILSRGGRLTIAPSDLGGPIHTSAKHVPAEPRRLEDAERAFIVRALEESGWVVGGPQGAAARLGLRRSTLQARMRKLGIVRPRSPSG